jgi:flagellar motor switch protein FliN
MSQSVVSRIVMPELVDTSQAPASRPIDVLGQVPAQVVVIAGRAEMSLAELRDLDVGDVLSLDRGPDATVDVCVNGVHIARGDMIVLDEMIATRISELDPKPES